MRHGIALIFALLLVCTSASARETDYDLPIQEDLESELGKEKLLDVPLYFHGQKHPPVAEEIAVERSNRKTRGVFRSDRNGCRVAFLSSVRALQALALKRGADAIVDIRSVTRHKNLESPTQYRCVAGATIVHVSLEGRLVRLAQ